MAAFFGATTTDIRTAQRRRNNEDKGMAMNAAMDVRNKLMPEIEKMIETGGGDIRRERNGIENFIGANQWSISDAETNTLKLPFDYKSRMPSQTIPSHRS